MQSLTGIFTAVLPQHFVHASATVGQGISAWDIVGDPGIEQESKELDPEMESDTQKAVLDCDLIYAAFRAALVTTLDHLLAEYLDSEPRTADRGFLDRFPLMQGTAPQVQLECLLHTWKAIQSDVNLTIVEELVIQGAAETLADLSREGSDRLLKMVWRGPRVMSEPVDHWLSSKLRLLQILVSEHDLPRLCMLSDSGPVRETLPEGVAESVAGLQRIQLLQVVGRWRVSDNLASAATGLATSTEENLIQAFFEEHRSLVS